MQEVINPFACINV